MKIYLLKIYKTTSKEEKEQVITRLRAPTFRKVKLSFNLLEKNNNNNKQRGNLRVPKMVGYVLSILSMPLVWQDTQAFSRKVQQKG